MISESLKTLREELGISQNTIAEQLNISTQSISKWERGESLPSIEYLPKLAKIFVCKIDDLFAKYPYNETQEDKLFELLKSDKKDKIEKAKNMLNKNPSLNTFLCRLNDLLYSKRYAFINVIMENFNFGYNRAKRVIELLVDMCILTMRNDNYFVEKERLSLFDSLLSSTTG